MRLLGKFITANHQIHESSILIAYQNPKAKEKKWIGFGEIAGTTSVTNGSHAYKTMEQSIQRMHENNS